MYLSLIVKILVSATKVRFRILWDSSRIRPCLSWRGEWVCKDFPEQRTFELRYEGWVGSPRECLVHCFLHILSSEELITDPSMFKWRRLIEVSKGKKIEHSYLDLTVETTHYNTWIFHFTWVNTENGLISVVWLWC